MESHEIIATTETLILLQQIKRGIVDIDALIRLGNATGHILNKLDAKCLRRVLRDMLLMYTP